MPFVLVATTTGDELIKPERKNVLVCDDRAALEAERDRRAAYRKQWLATHELQWFEESSVFASEEIEEVPTLAGGTTAGSLAVPRDGGLSQRETL